MLEIIAAALFSIIFIFAITVVFGAPWIPSFPVAVQTILKLSKAKKGDRIVDLGSGDGRILIAFAKAGIEADGWEINPIMWIWSLVAVRRAGVSKLAHLHLGSFWTADLSKFHVVVIYGVSGMMERMQRKLVKECQKNTKIISAIFPFPNWEEEKEEGGIFLYRI